MNAITTNEINIGISEASRTEVATKLQYILANNYSLYLKTQSFHWNVTGPMFVTLHNLFEEQYTELASANDVLAERIRSLGYFTIGSFSEFSHLSSVTESNGELLSEEMIRQLLAGNELLARSCVEASRVASDANDDGTADLLTERANAHQKSAWILRSLIE